MQIIGTRTNSTWRVDSGYYERNPLVAEPGVDPTTGGPIAVVTDYTDDVLPEWAMDLDPQSHTYRQLIHTAAPAAQESE